METLDTKNLRMLIYVGFDESKNSYNIALGQGSSVPETAFAITVIIKSLLKNGLIEKAEQFTDLINKYLTDPQYDEVKDNGKQA